MSTVNTGVVIAVFILILVLSLIAAIIIDPMNFDKSRFRTFIVTAASMGIIITVMWYLFLVEQNSDNQKMVQCNERRHVEDVMLNASVKSIQDNAEIIPRMCSSLLPLQNISNPPPSTHSQHQQDIHIATLSYQLFDTWEHYTTTLCRPTGTVAYFLQWSTSPILKEQWKKQYVNFDRRTQDFGDRLFAASAQIEDIHCPYSYQDASDRFIRDCKRMKILV